MKDFLVKLTSSRKFLMTVAFWCYTIGGMVSGQIPVQEGTKLLGLSGGGWILVEGIIDAITRARPTPSK